MTTSFYLLHSTNSLPDVYNACLKVSSYILWQKIPTWQFSRPTVGYYEVVQDANFQQAGIRVPEGNTIKISLSALDLPTNDADLNEYLNINLINSSKGLTISASQLFNSDKWNAAITEEDMIVNGWFGMP